MVPVILLPRYYPIHQLQLYYEYKVNILLNIFLTPLHLFVLLVLLLTVPGTEMTESEMENDDQKNKWDSKKVMTFQGYDDL